MKLYLLKQLSCECYSHGVRMISVPLAMLLIATLTLTPAQTVRAESASAIEEVVVTARKRDESLQEVPVVVNVLTEDAINSQRIEGIGDIGAIVPGMVSSRAASGTAGIIYLRGIGTGGLNPSFDQAVAINLDGVGINSAQMMRAGMIDLRQIEVLKGPQALFYGKNSPGGVIAIHSNDPTDELEVELTVAYATETEEPTIRGIISGPLGDTLSGRLSFGFSEADAYGSDVYNSDIFETGPTGDPVQVGFATPRNQELDTSYVMGTLLWEPSDDFSAKLKYAHLQDDSVGNGSHQTQRIWCGLGVPQIIHPVNGISECSADDTNASPGINPALLDELRGGRYAGTREGFNDIENNFAVLEMNYHTAGGLTLTSVSGYFSVDDERLSDSSFQQVSGLVAAQTTGLEQWSQELRLTSNYDGNANFAVGVFYESKEFDRDTDVSAGGNMFGLVPFFGMFPFSFGRQLSYQDSTAYSVFGQLNWDVSEKVTLALGGRYSYEEKRASQIVEIRATPQFGAPAVPPTDVPYLNDDTDWNNFSPEVTVSYQYTDDIMFFASYREGFKSGGYDLSYRTGDLVSSVFAGELWDNIYDEEVVDGFEVGMKSTLLDGTLRLNVTAYSYDYDDLQVSQFDADASGAQSFSISNAAAASVDGVDVETLWVTQVEGLTLTANFAWGSFEYEDFTTECWTGQTIAMGCNLDPDPVTGNFRKVDMSGEPLPLASDLSATLGLIYDTQLSSNWNLSLNLTGSFKDDYHPGSELIPDGVVQDGYWIINAAASLYSSDDRWEIYVRGVNLGDEYYTVSIAGAPFSGNDALTGTNDPSGLQDFLGGVPGGREITMGIIYRM